MNRDLQNRIEVAGKMPPKEGEASDGDLIAELEASRDENGFYRCGLSFALDPTAFSDPDFAKNLAPQIEGMAMDLANYLGRCRALYKDEL